MYKIKNIILIALFTLLTISQIPSDIYNGVDFVRASPPQQWFYNQGNWTYIDKLGLPTPVDNIGIGENWTYVFNLNKDQLYHVYFYGEWISQIGKETDYDIFVYDPNGNLETYHTESAGLIEHLGTTVDNPLFQPLNDGNYSFLLINDPKESTGTENGTLIVVEHLDINKPYNDKLYMEGKDPITDNPRFYTTWIYEFNSTSKNIEIPVEVPDTLDMYEVRLYLMANPNLDIGENLLNMPIAWEPGLYGDKIYNGYDTIGGMNINFTDYRGNAFDSCEYPGEDMLINFTTTHEGNLLYHLVFIAELGYGNLSFTIKTDVTEPELNVTIPSDTLTGEETTVTAISSDEESGIDKVTILYSTDNGTNWDSIIMTEYQSYYVAHIPEQTVGTEVLYKVESQDQAGNRAIEEGVYLTKNQSNIHLILSESTINGGDALNLAGSIKPTKENATIVVQYTDPQGSVSNKTTETDSSGNFSDSYTPNMGGTWKASVIWNGDITNMAVSNSTSFYVEKMTQNLDVNLAKNKIVVGEDLEINGHLSPALSGATINLIIIGPKGNATTKKVQTTSQGTYSLDYSPNSEGSWSIMAMYQGDDLHKGTSTETLSFKVSGSGSFSITFLLIPVAVVCVIIAIILIRRMRSKKLIPVRSTYSPSN
jgi:hypothetical protein